MGWSTCSSHNTKTKCVADLLNDVKRSGHTLLGHASTNQGAYFAIITPQGKGLILCVMIERHSGLYSTKDMDEGMGPAMNDCPLKLLDLVDGPGTEYALRWREGVRAFHKHKSFTKELIASIRPGMTIALYKKHYTVMDKTATNLVVKSLDNGALYRIGASQYKSVSIEA
jgi:hypothetical protein